MFAFSPKKWLYCALLCVNSFCLAEDSCCPDECTPDRYTPPLYTTDLSCLPYQGPLTLRGDLLYFKANVDQSSFAIKSSHNSLQSEVFPNGKRHFIHNEYKPAARVEASYEFCDGRTSLDGRFTYFDAKQKKSVSGEFLFDTIGFPGNGAQVPKDTAYDGKAQIKHKYRYYAVEATLNTSFDCFCPKNLTFLFGINYSNIDFKQNFHSFGSFESGDSSRLLDNHFDIKSQFWGVGPELGFDYLYSFPLCFCRGEIAFVGRARSALLCSCTKAHLHYHSERTGPIGVNLRNEHNWRVNPTANAQLGLRFAFNCYCFRASIEAGYEWLWINKGIDKITGYDVAFAGDTLDDLEDFTLHGPYIGILASF